MQQGQFREDLYYRLNLFDLVVPPLRERIADIPLLSYSIMSSLMGPERINRIRIAKEVLSLFSTHSWRGNVRELRNILTYAIYSMKEEETELGLRHLPERFFHKADNEFLNSTIGAEEGSENGYEQKSVPAPDASGKLSENKAEVERRTILDALKKCGGNKMKAAKMLGIARSSLYRKMSALKIQDYAAFSVE